MRNHLKCNSIFGTVCTSHVYSYTTSYLAENSFDDPDGRLKLRSPVWNRTRIFQQQVRLNDSQAGTTRKTVGPVQLDVHRRGP